MNTQTQPDNHLFKKMMIAVLFIIASIFYTFFRIQFSGNLLWQDNAIITTLSAIGVFMFARATKKDRYRLDKI